MKTAGLPPLDLMEGFYSDDEEMMSPFILLDMKYKSGELTKLDMSGLNRVRASLPIKWECLNPSPLHELLSHSDCDGEISWHNCKPIADELTKLLDKLPDGGNGGHIVDWKTKTKQFIDGLLLAHSKKENLIFS